MTRALAPRGPDEQAFWHDPSGNAAFGFRRLAILDISGGHQPATNEDQTVHLVFNGEIYNFPELHHRLQAQGHSLTGRGDTACLPHLYEADATKMFARLRGMFAIAVWDSSKKRLVLGRDRFGQKPLVYRKTASGQLHFASELKSLRAADPDWHPQISPIALDQYLAFGYVPAPLTIYQGVYKLPPGHYATYQNDCITVEPYWSMNWSETEDSAQIPLTKAVDQFRSILDEAVTEQNVADVPVGVFLSGGIDSSIVAGLSARVSKEPLRSFSVAFDDPRFDESPQAEAFAKSLGANHTTIRVDFNAWETLQQLSSAYDEPLADNSALPTWLLARETSRHVKVVLSGDGGDELALGYDRYRAIALADRIRKNLPDKVLQFLSGPLASRIPSSSRAKTRGRRIKSFLKSIGISQLQLVSKWLISWNEEDRFDLYKPDALDRLVDASELSATSPDPMELIYKGIRSASARPLVRQSQSFDTSTSGYLAGDLMFKVDMATMAHSLECRSPFLDHRLFEYCGKLPESYLIDPVSGKGKRLFALSCQDVVPKEVFNRPKMGFSAPVDRWLKGPLAEPLELTLLGSDSKIVDHFNPDTIRRIIHEHRTGQADHAYKLWSLLVLELWMRSNLP
jgi:asparagine synthase (glutamine-hydrolysing)